MRIEANTKIVPIIAELNKIIPSDYLVSTNFQKSLISIDFDVQWKSMLDYIKDNRGYYAPGEDFSRLDARDAITLACNSYYEKLSVKHLLKFVLFLLDSYTSYNNGSIDVDELIDDFMLLGLSEDDCAELKKYQGNQFNIVFPNPSDMIRDGGRISILREKIDRAQKDNDYNSVITYSFTFLEGILKGVCNHFGIDYQRDEEINKLAGKVKAKLKECLPDSLFYMTNAYNQITNITNFVDRCRNIGSDSHFDKQADAYISMFIRDEVYSLANLFLTIIRDAQPKEN